jgi:hypothetical protein
MVERNLLESISASTPAHPIPREKSNPGNPTEGNKKALRTDNVHEGLHPAYLTLEFRRASVIPRKTEKI